MEYEHKLTDIEIVDKAIASIFTGYHKFSCNAIGMDSIDLREKYEAFLVKLDVLGEGDHILKPKYENINKKAILLQMFSLKLKLELEND